MVGGLLRSGMASLGWSEGVVQIKVQINDATSTEQRRLACYRCRNASLLKTELIIWCSSASRVRWLPHFPSFLFLTEWIPSARGQKDRSIGTRCFSINRERKYLLFNNHHAISYLPYNIQLILSPCILASSNSHCSWLRPVPTSLVRISLHQKIPKAYIPQQLTSSLPFPLGITAPGGQKALWDGSAKADQCFWSGTSPFCAGSCDSGYSDCGTSGCGNGACCWTGYKKYCCRGSCPAVLPFLEASPGKPLANLRLFPFQLAHPAF